MARHRSFTKAAEELFLTQSAVSRQISALEESLSVPLFHRHARGLILTEQGELLHRTVREVFAKLATAEAQRAGLTKNPTWKSYPRQMLRARCISEGIRTVYPGCIVGVYTPEEVQDMEPPREVKATVVEVSPPSETYPVHVPGGGIYSKASDIEGWAKTFNELAGKVLYSDKLTVEEKGAKMKGLWEANKVLIDSLPAAITDTLRKELADE